jgi:hypothetical protein
MKRTVIELLAAGMLLSCTAWAQQDDGQDTPDKGVARVSLINGDVSIRRGDSGDWVAAAVNAPLVVYDHVFTGANSRTEVQFDWANLLRLSADTEIRISELENLRYQVQLASGTVTLAVVRDSKADMEVDTPNVSVRPVQRGAIRITVLENGDSLVTVRSGEAEVFTPKGVERVGAGRTMVVRGSVDDPEYRIERAAAYDDWDRWNQDRDRQLERTASYQYVSPDIYGADDLDGYGRWVYVPPYGWVWSPNGVAADWAPYRYGRWSWLDWYGWTWVSYDPWGWAPYHYGRWFHAAPYGWCWYPGAIHSRYYWRPALVAFFGFGHGVNVGVGFGFGNVGWVPLAPYERYRPWYGRGYWGYGGQPVSNITVVNNTNVVNVYRNARVGNAITGIDAGDFARGRAGRSIHSNDPNLQRAGLLQGPVPVAPRQESLRVSDRQAMVHNELRREPQRFYTRRPAAAVERAPFEQQRRGMEQVVERSFGRPASPGGEPARGAVGGTARPIGGNEDRGAQRVETSPAGSGWRRIGEPGGAAERTRQPDQAPAQVETSPARSPQAQPEIERGAPGQNVQAPARVERQAIPRNSGDESWRRFGNPQRETQPPARIERQSQPPARVERENQPPAREQKRESEPPRQIRKEEQTFSGDSGADWSRFGSAPRAADPGARSSEPRRMEMQRSEPARFQAPRTEPLRINPPIVRERSTPRVESRGGGESRSVTRDSGNRGESRGNGRKR